MKVVGPNVSSILIANRIGPVSIPNVLIHAQELVQAMRSARWLIIFQCVPAFHRLPVILIDFARGRKRMVRRMVLQFNRNSFLNLMLEKNWNVFNYSISLDFLQDNARPCTAAPCGANSQCREINNIAVCSCLATYIGTPPNCRPECVSSSECPSNQVCDNQKCVNPCPSSCGINSDCRVINHSPLCSCIPGHTGDPFTRCFPLPRKLMPNNRRISPRFRL